MRDKSDAGGKSGHDHCEEHPELQKFFLLWLCMWIRVGSKNLGTVMVATCGAIRSPKLFRLGTTKNKLN